MKLHVFAVLVLISIFSCDAADWPQWRGANRDGISTENLKGEWPRSGPKILWRASVGTGFSSFAISKGRVYTMGNSGDQDTIWCFDARTGKELWHHTYPAQLGPQYYEGGPGSTPTVESNRVFTISKWGDVFCLEAATGKIVWQHDLRKDGIQPNRWGFAGSPLLWHNLVILNAGAAGTALERASGKTVWSTGTNATGYASPTIFKWNKKDEVLIFAAKNLVALNPKTGQEIWRFFWETGYDTNNPDPLPYGEKIFISSYSRGCALLSAKSNRAEPVYIKDVVHNHLSSGVLLGEYLYVFNGQAKGQTDFRCIHLPTGELKWTKTDPAFGSVISAGGKLVILSDKGELMMAEASPEAFDVSARAQILGGLCWTPPALANGLLYARNAKGDVVCVDMKNP